MKEYSCLKEFPRLPGVSNHTARESCFPRSKARMHAVFKEKIWARESSVRCLECDFKHMRMLIKKKKI